ncbi:hypothetical protein CPJCM30710_04220 [Clostridium polyendosporum]|uniref:Aromatic acid exporter family member 1 n=1 Tax=Clostridium polyendosporum TaxID=69208 RepID=A0A919RWP3_9CLOT|nr:aromatic acid exporter family protein [Clostridium polyendosporum]GIM27756.1 hypothetical protein CPJCM30710_04220 [Clostridium polyendosporum]
MSKRELPQIGLRNIKTAISVFLCIVLFQALDRPYPFYACIAAVMCTKETVAITYKASFDRMIGSILGGFMGMILIIISSHINFSTIESFMSGIGIVIVIYMCNLIKRPGACPISCIVLLSITTTAHDSTPYLYALNRVIDTFIGIIITIIINRFICPRESIC